jgi:hypothetical protein
MLGEGLGRNLVRQGIKTESLGKMLDALWVANMD